MPNGVDGNCPRGVGQSVVLIYDFSAPRHSKKANCHLDRSPDAFFTERSGENSSCREEYYSVLGDGSKNKRALRLRPKSGACALADHVNLFQYKTLSALVR